MAAGALSSSGRPLFECVLVVSLPTGSSSPQITYSFPPAWDSRSKGVNYKAVVPTFCFPDVGVKQKKKKGKDEQATETFSFVLTESDGSRQFAYCRKLPLSDGGGAECYCLLSSYTAFSMFAQILDIVEERRKVSGAAVFTFLKSTLAQEAPDPGQTLRVSTFPAGSGASSDVYELRRATDNDYLLDYVTFTLLFEHVKIDHILDLFDAVLCERRIILTSRKLSLLSSALTAFLAMLNPFSWQHTFIPVLPASLVDYTCAPMPFFIGVPAALVPSVLRMPLEEVYIFDLDKDAFIRRPKIKRVLPAQHAAQLRSALAVITKSDKRQSRSFDLLVAKRFLVFFYHIFGTYACYLDSAGHFKLDQFVAARPRDDQHFIAAFQSIQMWEVFLYERQEMIRKRIIDQCLFLRMAKMPAAELQEEFVSLPTLSCHKCAATLPADFELYHGSPVCDACRPAGFSLQRLLTRDKFKLRSLFGKKSATSSADDSPSSSSSSSSIATDTATPPPPPPRTAAGLSASVPVRSGSPSPDSSPVIDRSAMSRNGTWSGTGSSPAVPAVSGRGRAAHGSAGYAPPGRAQPAADAGRAVGTSALRPAAATTSASQPISSPSSPVARGAAVFEQRGTAPGRGRGTPVVGPRGQSLASTASSSPSLLGSAPSSPSSPSRFKFCTGCGYKGEADARFCTSCGFKS